MTGGPVVPPLDLIALSPRSFLQGPLDGRRISAPEPLTGGGLLAVLDPERGLRSLWSEQGSLAGELSLRIGAQPLRPEDPPRVGPGSWARTLLHPDLPDLEILEIGLVLDAPTGIVIQWTPEGRMGTDSEIAAELRIEPGARSLRTTLPLTAGEPTALAIVPGGTDGTRLSSLLRSLPAREMQRSKRGSTPGHPSFGVEVDGKVEPSVQGALEILDSASLSAIPDTSPAPAFVAGLRDSNPTFLSGAALAEVGMGALLAGRTLLARSILQALSRQQPSPGAPLLLLAASVVKWTGEPSILSRMREVLDAAVRRAAHDPPPPAAFPALSEILEELRRAAEPLGDAYSVPNPLASTYPDAFAGAPGRVRLPLAQEAAPPISDSHRRSKRARLPEPESFANPFAPGFLARRTLQGSRLLRAWTEGRLGARADASYGRLRLAPRMPRTTSSLRVSALRMGECLVGLDYRRSGETCTFVLRQDTGRIPINLIFEPWLPLSGVERVLLGEEKADVDVKRQREGVELRLQFPLDPERRIRIVGAR